MKNFSLDISLFFLIFLFLLFSVSNIGFLANLPLNACYITISFVGALIYLFKSGDFVKKVAVALLLILLSFIFSNFFIDTSFDGRCYHFTIENMFKLGFNPFWVKDTELWLNNNNLYFNHLFVKTYPNASELLRANFYLIFNNMESSKIVNYFFVFSLLFYSFYFFSRKSAKLKSAILTLCTLLCSVLICQINTKMVDFILYCLFCFQFFSILLIEEKKDIKINYIVLIMTSILSIGVKYTGLFNTFIIFALFLIYKFEKKKLASFAIVVFSSLILCAQPYILNLIKYKNPFYPSIGYNKLDFMTKQNPKEFYKKPYIYKFIRSMFSSVSDARMNNPETPKLYWKVPFTSHFDMPFGAEDVRISGFGHLFSGIFLISLILTMYFIKKRKKLFPLALIYLTVLLNPICWWARFVPQLHLLPIISAYFLRKNNFIFYILCFLIILNGYFVAKENILTNAYKTYVMNGFYNDLYEKSKSKKIYVYMDKTPNDEDDSTVLFRLKEYGVNYELSDRLSSDFKKIKTDCTISDSYYIKY